MSLRRSHISSLIACTACLGVATTAQSAAYVITAGGASQVEFVSKAPMESFGGKTHAVSGQVTLDPTQLADTIDVQVDVDMRTLDTGIELRNKHMRENHLECDKFPQATFHGGHLSKLSATKLTEGEPLTGMLDGTLELHGVTQPVTVPVEMTLQNGALHVVSHFKVKLPDYKIARPQFLVMKLEEVQSVTVDVEARPR